MASWCKDHMIKDQLGLCPPHLDSRRPFCQQYIWHLIEGDQWNQYGEMSLDCGDVISKYGQGLWLPNVGNWNT